jgi:hypothetical protein
MKMNTTQTLTVNLIGGAPTVDLPSNRLFLRWFSADGVMCYTAEVSANLDGSLYATVRWDNLDTGEWGWHGYNDPALVAGYKYAKADLLRWVTGISGTPYTGLEVVSEPMYIPDEEFDLRLYSKDEWHF